MVKVIFLDDGGVMNDNQIRGGQWQELVAQFFIPRFGGMKAEWKSANRYALIRFMEKYERIMHKTPLLDFNPFLETMMDRWLTDMCKKVKINPPPHSERFQLVQEAEKWITPRVKSAYPGIIEIIKTLKRRGYTLCTASGEASWTLKGYLSGMGIIDCFTNLYGPDLINTAKRSSKYYQKIINDMNISPSDGIIVDDSSMQLAFAHKLGMITIHILHDSKCEESSCDYHIRYPNELLDLILKIEQE